MSAINISVYHIIHFTLLIDKTFKSLEQLAVTRIFDNNKNEELRSTILINAYSQMLLFTNSLIDEYSTHFIIAKAQTAEEKAKVEQTREVLKPVFRKISKWEEIKDFRNNILAHNLRIQKEGHESVFISKGLSGYNIPERISDFAFLIRCIDLIRQIIIQMFKNEYEVVLNEINLRNEESKENVDLSQRDYEKEYEQLRNDIWKIKEQIEARFS